MTINKEDAIFWVDIFLFPILPFKNCTLFKNLKIKALIKRCTFLKVVGVKSSC